MLRQLAAFCFRRRKLVVAMWVVGVIGLTVVASQRRRRLQPGLLGEGHRVQSRPGAARAHVPAQAGDSGQLVVQAPAGVDDPAVRQAFDDKLAAIERVPHVTGTTSPYSPEGARQVSANGNIAYAEIQFDQRAGEVSEATAEKIIDLAGVGTQADGTQFEVGGRMFQIGSFRGSSELIGLLAAVIILLIAFGSVLAMGLPIFTAILGIGGGFAIVGLLSNVMVMPTFTTQLAAMIGLGVGIDYALFIVTRFRQGPP